MAAAEEAPEMSKPQEAALQRDIAAILLPGESVTKALQRLGKQDKRPAGVQRRRCFTKSLCISDTLYTRFLRGIPSVRKSVLIIQGFFANLQRQAASVQIYK